MDRFKEYYAEGLGEWREIWRFMKINRTKELLSSNKLPMVNPIKMHDVGDHDEGRVNQALYDFACEKRKDVLSGYLNSLYCSYISCWTLERNTEAEYDRMWTEFGGNHTGVAIKSTVSLIGEELDLFVEDSIDDYTAPRYGKIIYNKSEQDKYQDLDWQDPMFPLFFIAGKKDNAYLDHEKEVRFIFMPWESSTPSRVDEESILVGKKDVIEDKHKKLKQIPIRTNKVVLELVLGRDMSAADELAILALAKASGIKKISKAKTGHIDRFVI